MNPRLRACFDVNRVSHLDVEVREKAAQVLSIQETGSISDESRADPRPDSADRSNLDDEVGAVDLGDLEELQLRQ
jgi:hypothetical protein